MGVKESFIKAMTPRNTEEVKPGLFIREGQLGYKQVSPPAWDGKIIWKNFFFGHGFMKSTFFFLLLLFLVWSYSHDVEAYQNFYIEVAGNPRAYCDQLDSGLVFSPDIIKDLGMPEETPDINISNIEIILDKESG